MSVLSSVRLNGDLVPLVFEGALNGVLFKEYVTQCLAPTLRKGDIMDNLTAHKVKRVADLIGVTGADVVYLPSTFGESSGFVAKIADSTLLKVTPVQMKK
jgi:hypothetical protein